MTTMLLMLAAGYIAAQPPQANVREWVNAVMQPGEELIYEVSWGFFKLGKVRIVTHPAPLEQASAFSAAAFSDSYKLPFVDFHAISTSEMDSTLFSYGSSLFEKKEKNWFRQIYYFDTRTKMFVTENATVPKPDARPIAPPTHDTLKVTFNRFHDGTSILFFARARVHSGVAVRVPTFVRGKAGYTNFYLPTLKTSVSIDAVPHTIKAVELEGKAEFEGIFGLTGEFTGWFSDDAAAVPLKAKMKVILGSITIELKEWKRAGWSPPQAE